MPNWSENHVDIIGDKKDIAAIKKLLKVGRNVFSLNKIVPMSKVLD